MYRNDRAHGRRLQASHAKTRVALIDYNLYASHGSLACTRVFLAPGRSCFSFSLSLFFPLERQGRKKKGRRRDKKKKWRVGRAIRTKFPECKRGTARSACALADCSTPRIDLSIVFERRRWRLPQTFVYKCEYRSSYRRLERLNAPHSSVPRSIMFDFSLSLSPSPSINPSFGFVPLANSNVGFQFRRDDSANDSRWKDYDLRVCGFVGNTRISSIEKNLDRFLRLF